MTVSLGLRRIRNDVCPRFTSRNMSVNRSLDCAQAVCCYALHNAQATGRAGCRLVPYPGSLAIATGGIDRTATVACGQP
jgi:hypothetical protein